MNQEDRYFIQFVTGVCRMFGNGEQVLATLGELQETSLINGIHLLPIFNSKLDSKNMHKLEDGMIPICLKLEMVD